LISQGVPQLGASYNVDMAKASLHTHTLSRAYLAFKARGYVAYAFYFLKDTFVR